MASSSPHSSPDGRGFLTTPPHSSASPSPSLSLSFSSLLGGGSANNSSSGPLSPNNAASPSHLSVVASLIAQSFAPRIAVFASDDANEFARDMGFDSLLELLRPFGDKVKGPVVVRDSQGITSTLEDFGIRFVSSNFAAKAMFAASLPQQGTGSGPSSSSQSTPTSSPTKTRARSNSKAAQMAAQASACFDIYDLDRVLSLYLAQSPRFFSPTTSFSPAAMHDAIYHRCLKRLLATPPISAHETFAHPVASVIAISSRNPQPIETLSMLYKTGNDTPVPNYMSKDYLRYYILIHDEDHSEIEKSIALFERMKRHFGLHCHMIRMHSSKVELNATEEPIQAVPHSEWISAAEEVELLQNTERKERYIRAEDASNLQAFVREMTVQSLIPFMERCVNTWNDQIASSRRGLTGRFFSASRRFLGTNSRAAGAGASAGASGNYDPVTSSYGFMTAEAQMRKLADYAVMLRDWRLAQSTYDILRKDFLNDKAWKYHAGAQEMAATSLILSGTPLSSKTRMETLEPMLDSATYSYTSRCNQPTYALRTILMASELLRSRGGGAADDAARWLMKAISEKLMGNLAHALIIERVSACYAIRRGMGSQGWGSRRRKAAFWQLVAAKEWIGLDKKPHALECLEEAGECAYYGLPWTEVPGSLMYELRESAQSMVMYDSGKD
ncbi:ER-golgi trafficking TRAPP I complex 85 kDa subunit-domain-containing protein [Myxozyma melibiosi]|uniref:ER-golgi trafficking TRAPP I complex 85 kDa subunit-domain-containing protein n=1 Tax=Myxozyma melibiosi TaxID=54550 RepID=A0ABR1FE50_9ASCO